MGEEKVILCLDKGLHLKPEEVKEALHQGGAKNTQDAWVFPTNTAKFVSPLDNSLWHTLKTRVHARKPQTEEETAQALEEEFMSMDVNEIRNYYKHCALTRGSDSYKDVI